MKLGSRVPEHKSEEHASSMALGPMKLKGYDVRLRDFSETDKHQGQLLRIVYQAP